VLWGLIRICTKGYKISLILTPVFISIYLWWYPSSFTLNSAFLGIFIVYSLIFQRKRVVNYEAMILLFLSITTMSIFLKFGLIFALFLFFIYKKELVNWHILGIIGILVLALFIIKGGLNPIWFNLRFYILRDVADNAHNASAIFHYFNVNQTIQESGIVPPKIFMERISSHTIVFVIALFGYALLCFKHKEFLLSLPLLALGFLANKAGLRFTIYAVGVMGLSFGYILYFGIKNLNMPKFLQRILLFSATLAALYPAWTHIRDYKADTVFFRSEVEILDKLKNLADREDYVLAWWDYGYPIRYYSDTKTLIDGGKHLGDDNFPVSFSLFKDQVSAANMARLAVEYTERKFEEKFGGDIMQKAIKDYNVSDINDFLLSLRFEDFTPPKASRDVYFYLPDRMNNIFPVIMQFSNLDLKTGQKFVDPLYYSGAFYGKDEYGVNIGGGVMLRNDLLVAKIGGKEYSINTFYETSYDANGKLVVKEIAIDSSAGLYVIFMKDYGRFILLDSTPLKSAY
ncbi:MAG: general glycosylation pathway protein, partial [Campylobacter sp.]|nr:general glycosylation pathway protein [Campylobacter sp.]